ncbi:MAG: ATP synthase F1 subunit epsilon [Planctomycetaceae bacterium]|nr:ATP synthase F1 subunit epsilon [Planctomycetaceae bacterium]
MIAANSIQLTVVTPETTLLDEQAAVLQFPLEDGQIGILPGHAPMVGRLGIGELTVTTSKGTTRLFVDGGFVQVKGQSVTLLTNQAHQLEDFSAAEVEKSFNEAIEREAKTPFEQSTKQHDIDRNRKLLSLLNKS